MDAFTMARQLRMTSVQEALKTGALTRDLALNILAQPLDPTDQTTAVDDSALLDDPQAADKIAVSCPICLAPIGNFLTEAWSRKSALYTTHCPKCGAFLQVRVRQFIKFDVVPHTNPVTS